MLEHTKRQVHKWKFLQHALSRYVYNRSLFDIFTSKYGFSPDLKGKNGGVLSMRMQVILDSSFARPGSAPIMGWEERRLQGLDQGRWTN